jgi:exonuclease VII small subunit
MTRTTDATSDDPILGLIAKRKAEALARAEKEHKQLEAAAKLFAQGSKLVNDAEEGLRKGREKQDTAIASMLGAGLDNAAVAETLGLTTKAVTESVKRHKAATAPEGEAAAPAPVKATAKKAAGRPRGVSLKPEEPADAETGTPPADADTDAPSDAPADDAGSDGGSPAVEPAATTA